VRYDDVDEWSSIWTGPNMATCLEGLCVGTT